MGIVLVANPGSSSRKYALYEVPSLVCRATVQFEMEDDRVVCTVEKGNDSYRTDVSATTIPDAVNEIESLFNREGIVSNDELIDAVGLRVVAPSVYFMQDHLVTDEVIAKLKEAEHLAPLHIAGTLGELDVLSQQLSHVPIYLISDSAFHRTKPNYAWNYGINIHDADRLDVKRFGYHGISVASAVDALWNRGKLPPKVIVCHLGSGSSITAVFHGRSIDNTMGFTPNEGIIMATRSGNISPDATNAIKRGLQLDDKGLEEYLNKQAGLLGLSESNDIRELLAREADGDHFAHLALTTLVHSYHKAIGSMMVALNGCDLLVFTGTVGERSAVLRKRIVAHLEFADFILDGDLNDECTSPEVFTGISQAAKSKPIIVIPTNEELEIARHTSKLLSS